MKKSKITSQDLKRLDEILKDLMAKAPRNSGLKTDIEHFKDQMDMHRLGYLMIEKFPNGL